MFGLDLKIFDRQAAARARDQDGKPGDGEPEASDYFIRSYLGMRFMIGLVAFALPWALILIDWWLITSQRQIRGSMSAYYHSPARDVFVGGLIVTGGFLFSYMIAKPRTYDFWLSTMAGLAIIAVAMLPTGRSLGNGFTTSADSCTKFPGPPACNAIQETLGESKTGLIHGVSATLFVLLLAALCLVFALREFGYGPAAEDLCGRHRSVHVVRATLRALEVPLWTYLWDGVPRRPEMVRSTAAPPRRRVLLYLATCILILLAGAWAKFGVSLPLPLTSYELGETYVGEVVAFSAFGVAWMVSGKDLRSVRQLISGTARVLRLG